MPAFLRNLTITLSGIGGEKRLCRVKVTLCLLHQEESSCLSAESSEHSMKMCFSVALASRFGQEFGGSFLK